MVRKFSEAALLNLKNEKKHIISKARIITFREKNSMCSVPESVKELGIGYRTEK